MNNRIKTLAIASILSICIAVPSIGSAQRWPNQNNRDRNYGYGYNQRDLRDLVARTERESNEFRSYFEHNFRSSGNPKRDDRWDNGRDDHGDHQGRRGQMTLRDAIQNLDEAMERLRGEVNRSGGRSRKAQEIFDDVLEHSGDVDQRIGRVSDWYDYYGSGGRDNYNNRNWRYDRSDLSSRWRELRSDINSLARSFGSRTRW